MNRLAAALLLLLILSSASAQTRMGNWVYQENIDLFTDEDASYAYALVHDAPRFADDAEVTLFCGEGTFNGVVVGFFLDDYMGSGDTADVTYRVDGGEPVSMEWMLIDEAVYLQFNAFGDQERVYDDWIDGDLLIFRATTRLASNTYQVRIDGMREAVEVLDCSRYAP